MATLAWSSIGYGAECLTFLQDAAGYFKVSVAVLVISFLVLYMLDFFSPPHMPGRYCILFEGDCIVGPTLVGIVGVAFFLSCLLMAKEYPSTPILATTFLGPVGLVSLRSTLTFKQGSTPDHMVASLEADDGDRSLHVLKFLMGEEHDQRSFFIAACAALLFTAFACLAVWLPWAIIRGHQLDEMEDKAEDDRELEVLYILWAAPLVLAVSDLLFGLILYLRVYMSRVYVASDHERNQLIVDCLSKDARSSVLKEAGLTRTIGRGKDEVLDVDESRRQQLLEQHHSHMRQLVQIVRIVGCILVFKLGATYVSFSLVAVDSHIASMVQNFLGALFLFFIGFVYTSFKRLWDHMHLWLTGSSLWNKAIEAINSSWMRAALLGIFLPLLPFIVLLSMANQWVRCCRGLTKSLNSESSDAQLMKERGSDESSKTPGKDSADAAGSFTGRCLTRRVHKQLLATRKWPWLQIICWVYCWTTVLVILILSPRLLNVFLSAMSKLLEGLPFSALVLITCLIGLLCFLLPPVPGAPIYFFAGAMFTKACPWGFWTGAVVSIICGWLMKLGACAMQQKLIGEQLGGKLWVRSACGVHKPFIRTIESVLAKPGLSMGKVAILCGGPDWPTSVLAGILKLSLLQCELGTMPIVFFIAPFSLSGSFYLKRDEGEIWARAGNLMFTLTGFVCVVLWALMAWAWQKEFDEKFEHVTQPMEKYIELDWIDHCAEEFKKSCEITWQDVPIVLKVIYACGAVLLVLVCHLFWWNTNSCFGEFAVTDDIGTLVVYGPDGVVKFRGAVGLGTFLLGLCGLLIYQQWRKRRIREPIAALKSKLAATEASWKQQRFIEVRAAARRQQAENPAGPKLSTVCSAISTSGAARPQALRGVVYNFGGSERSGGSRVVPGAQTILSRQLLGDQPTSQSTAAQHADSSGNRQIPQQGLMEGDMETLQFQPNTSEQCSQEAKQDDLTMLQPQPNPSGPFHNEAEHAGTQVAGTDDRSPPPSPQPKPVLMVFSSTDDGSPPPSPQPKRVKKIIKRKKRKNSKEAGPAIISSDRDTDVPSAEEVEDKPDLAPDDLRGGAQGGQGTSEALPPQLSTENPTARHRTTGSLFFEDQ